MHKLPAFFLDFSQRLARLWYEPRHESIGRDSSPSCENVAQKCVESVQAIRMVCAIWHDWSEMAHFGAIEEQSRQ